MLRPWLAQAVLLAMGLLFVTEIGLAGDAPSRVLPLGSDAVDRQSRQESDAAVSSARRGNAILPVAATVERVDVLQPGTSDRQTLRQAKAALPLHLLSPDKRRRAEEVLENLSMFRAMPTVKLAVDHDVYRYFVEHPDVAVSIWRALGVSKCQLWQTGHDSYETDVGDGSTGVIDVLLRSEHDHLVLGEGEFKSPLIVKPIRAKALLHVRTEYFVDHDGETHTVCRGNLFVMFPSQTVETAAKVISPVTNMVIDRNFEEIGLFAHMMTLAMRNQPGWVEMIVDDLDGILERRRGELLQVAAKAYATNKRRELSLDSRTAPSQAGVPPAPAAPIRR